MSLITDIKSLDANGVLLGGAILFGLLIPGMLTLYFYDRAFLLESSALVTAFLAISIAAPSFVMLFVTTLISEKVFSQMMPETTGRFGGFREWAITHAVSNASIFFIALLLCIFAHISAAAFVAWILGLFFIYACFEFYRLFSLAKGKANPDFRDPNERQS